MMLLLKGLLDDMKPFHSNNNNSNEVNINELSCFKYLLSCSGSDDDGDYSYSLLITNKTAHNTEDIATCYRLVLSVTV